MNARRTAAVILAAFCAAAGGLLVGLPASALAAAGPPTVEGESVFEVGSGSATFSAQINPGGEATEYHFEYGPCVTASTCASSAYGESVPVPDASVGSGFEIQEVSVHTQDLLPDTTYHLRVAARNDLGQAVDVSEQTFITQRAGIEFTLPDNRVWELVSPPDKYNGALQPINPEQGLVQASENGDAITYAATGPVVADPPGNALNNTRVLSTRGPGGWSSQDIETPNEVPTVPKAGKEPAYLFFSSDLSLAILEPPEISPPLSPGASGATVYLRNDLAGTYQALGTHASTQFEGASPDLGHIILNDREAGLDPSYPEASGLYEWGEGEAHPRLVGVLPDGKPITTGAGLGDGLADNADVRYAVSNDGSRVVWHESTGTGGGEGHLYLRDMSSGETVQVDEAQGVIASGTVDPVFQTASEDGSRVFFTDEQKLTPGSGASYGSPDLYVFEVTSGSGEKLAGRLTDLTIDENSGESADVVGTVPGAGEDGSYVYFIADGALAPGAAHGNCTVGGGTRQQCNLYVERYSGTTWERPELIAALSGEDSPDWSGDLGNMTSRVSPNGRYLAFMSDRSLTGYDNDDASSGEPDEEVFLYDAGSDRLVCASCNPTGARPIGVLDTGGSLRVDPLGDVWQGHWLSGSVPGWTPDRLAEAYYQSRYLSNSGRLFFDSADELVPQDINGKEDVYEYEPPGVGSCTEASTTFSTRSEGCVGLISSGTGDEESEFLDASASGDDVFFLTAAKLVPQDADTAVDVYDARVCSEADPCMGTSVAPPPCDTEDSCRVAPEPQPAIFGAPSSATFSGQGNAAGPAVKPAVKQKSLTRAQKLAKALKACKKKARKKRAACRRQAAKRYGSKAKAKAKKSKAKRSKARKSLSGRTRR